MQAGSPGQADAGLVGLLASYSHTRLQVRHAACLAGVVRDCERLPSDAVLKLGCVLRPRAQ